MTARDGDVRGDGACRSGARRDHISAGDAALVQRLTGSTMRRLDYPPYPTR